MRNRKMEVILVVTTINFYYDCTTNGVRNLPLYDVFCTVRSAKRCF